MVAKAFRQSEQQKEVSNRYDFANRAVNSSVTSGTCSFAGCLVPGLKSRLHTRHLGGNTASRKMFKSDLVQREVLNSAK
jgi:hypothetical protein